MRPRVSILRSSAVVLATLLVACARQQEGDRCSRDNGNDDCASGLTCVPALGYPGICCPPVGSQTTDVCSKQGSVVTDSGPGADTGPTDAPSDSTDADTGRDSASDSADGSDTSGG